MWHCSSGIALVAFVAVMVSGLVPGGTAQDCNRETCPPGPVIAYFEHSNCTGQVDFYSFAEANIGECINATTKSGLYALSDDFVERRLFDYTTDCGQNGDLASYTASRYYFGVCADVNLFPSPSRGTGDDNPSLLNFDPHTHVLGSRRASFQSILYLRNVNDTLFEVPQDPIKMEIPLWDSHPQECFSPNNCTTEEGENPVYYNTVYTNDTCAEAGSSIMFTNFTADTCYRYEGELFYIRVRCLDSHTIALDKMIGNGCEFIVKSDVTHSECGNGATELTCNAVPFAPSPTVPYVPDSSPTDSSPMISPSLPVPSSPTSNPTPFTEPTSTATPNSVNTWMILALLFGLGLYIAY